MWGRESSKLKRERGQSAPVGWPRGVLAGLLIVVAACTHQTLRIGPAAPAIVEPATPAPITLGIRVASFDRTRLKGDAVAERFVQELRDARLVQGVMFPVPAGADPFWELELIGHDEAQEPDSNFWKSALAAGLFPLAPFITLENDYTLRLEALVLRRRELVGSYSGEARIQHRYGLYANKNEMSADGFELAVRDATRALLTDLAQHLPDLLAADRGR